VLLAAGDQRGYLQDLGIMPITVCFRNANDLATVISRSSGNQLEDIGYCLIEYRDQC
jgi:hypothetical protein